MYAERIFKTKHFILIYQLSKLRSSFHIQQFSVTRNGDMNNTLQNLINKMIKT